MWRGVSKKENIFGILNLSHWGRRVIINNPSTMRLPPLPSRKNIPPQIYHQVCASLNSLSCLEIHDAPNHRLAFNGDLTLLTRSSGLFASMHWVHCTHGLPAAEPEQKSLGANNTTVSDSQTIINDVPCWRYK